MIKIYLVLLECFVLQLVPTACELMEGENRTAMAALFDKESVLHKITRKNTEGG